MIVFLNLGGGEIMMIVLFILLFFGADKIPEIARSLGRVMREVRDATGQIQQEIENGTRDVTKNMQIDQDFDEITENIKKDTDKNHQNTNKVGNIDIKSPDNSQARQ